ncbi:MAG: DNA polymerase III subunit alpha [Chloroflexi bacterium]|nr:DNA polymerase III subunit alpha [Chloroflexota bacterium]
MYTELHLHTNYSFHDGASRIDELVQQAKAYGYAALAATDHDNLCGAMEFALACRDAGIQPVTGCEVTLTNGFHLTLLAESRTGYGNLSWLISQAHQQDRQHPALDPSLIEGHTDGLIALSGCRKGEVATLIGHGQYDQAQRVATRYRELFGRESYFVELQHHRMRGDTERNRRLAALAEAIEVGTVATGNVHYHEPSRHRLHDCLTAIRHNQSVVEAYRHLWPNDELSLKRPSDMLRPFQPHGGAVANTVLIAERCKAFDLVRDLAYKFPDYRAPDRLTPQAYLEKLCTEAAMRRYGSLTPKVRQRLEHEFRLIKKHDLAGFLLIYRDIILLAHEVAVDLGISDPEMPVEMQPPCRGRGSSVAMLVGYLLGMSHIDPLHYDLTLERFLPEDALPSVPDIDLDFPRNIREELILRIHQKYGWERAALTGMIDTYRVKGAVRDIGKALGIPQDQIDKLAKDVDDSNAAALRDQMRLHPAWKDRADKHPWNELICLSSQIAGFPRQLAQHPGGMVISDRPLTEVVPIQPSAIGGRYVMQWDKDSIDEARFVKIDLLALGVLSQFQHCPKVIERQAGRWIDLSRIDFSDPEVYKLLHSGETVGIFQVESSAQIQTLPRLRPQNLIDMAHEVGAVRPGVGANNGVRHYIRRRSGEEPVTFNHPLERRALERTLGIVLFQDQLVQLGVDVAGFTPSEADKLRRAFGKRNADALIPKWWERFRDGAAKKGVDEATAKRIFSVYNGMYQFPEAHAFAFGVTAYQSAWLKWYYPLAFYIGLFNEQPMGFYSPESLKEDARRFGVTVLNPDVNRSEVLCVDEGDAIRLGVGYVEHIGAASAKAIVKARRERPYESLADFMQRAGLVQRQVECLIDAGAMDSLCQDRRQARWEAGLRYRPVTAQFSFALPVEQDMPKLPQTTAFEEMTREYQAMGIHPKGHVMAYVRSQLPKRVLTSTQALEIAEGATVTVAGLITHKQRPLAEAVFVNVEDEFGTVRLIVWAKTYERFKAPLNSPFVIVRGRVSRRENTFNVILESAWPLQVTEHTPRSRDFR